MTDAMPDLSHLTDEERQIIERVLQRQRQEESQEQELKRKYEQQLRDIEKQIEERMEIARKLVGTMDDAICQICQKTKFADGIGHKCYYCQLRSCARCGGRLQIKVKILTNSGGGRTDGWWQLFFRSKVAKQAGDAKYPASTGQRPSVPAVKDKSPTGPGATQQKTIWSCSLCQQRQQILAKTGKWFQQADSTTSADQQQQLSPVDGTSAKAKDVVEEQQPPDTVVSEVHPRSSENGTKVSSQIDHFAPSATSRREEKREHHHHPVQVAAPDTVPRQQPVVVSDRREETQAKTPTRKQSEPNAAPAKPQTQKRMSMVVGSPPASAVNNAPAAAAAPPTPPSSRVLHEQVSIRTYPKPQMARKEQLTLTEPDYVTPIALDERGPPSARPADTDQPVPLEDAQEAPRKQIQQSKSAAHHHRRQLATGAVGRHHHHYQKPHDHVKKLQLKADGIAPTTRRSDVAKPLVARPAVNSATAVLRHRSSFSSSDEDFPSTSECQSYEDMESEKSFSDSRVEPRRAAAPYSTVDVDATVNQQQPLQWQSSPDGSYIYRRVALRRHVGTSLGLKVVGGRAMQGGRLGAFITKVKRGSVADVYGRLVPGDEVLEWNGHTLQNASFDEVCNAINQSKFSDHIQLVVARRVQRPLLQEEYAVSSASSVSGYGGALQAALLPGSSVSLPSVASAISQSSGQAPIVMITAPLSEVLSLNQAPQPITTTALPSRVRGQIFGQIRLSLAYVADKQQLIINLHEAVDLPPRADGSPRNPYVKMFLLPDRSENSRRQSKTMAETCNPIWHQSMVYKGVTELDLAQRIIEVTVWDYDQYSSNDFLGEVLIDLSNVDLDDTPVWYTLIDMDEETALRKRLRQARAASYSTRGDSLSYGSYDDIRRSQSFMIAHDSPGAAYPGQLRHRRPHDNRVGYRERSITAGVSSGYRSDSALPQYPLLTKRRGQSYETKPLYSYDSAEEPEGRHGDWEPRQSGYYSDYGDHQRMDYRHQQRSSWNRKQQQQQSLTRRAMIPLELRPSSPTEESGNDTSSPSHINMRHLPRPPSRHHQSRSNDKQLSAQDEADMRYASSSGTGAAEPIVRGKLQSRANVTSADYLSDESETSISLTSARLEHPSVLQKSSKSELGRDQTRTSVQSGRTTSSTRETYASSTGSGDVGFFERASDLSAGGAGQAVSTVDSAMAAEKRKRNLMTRLIPSRNSNAQLINEQRRIGFRRSDEVGVPANLSPQTSFDIAKQSSRESTDSNESSLVPMVQEHGSMGEFVEGLGPGQVIGRQAIASPCLGEIQLALCEHRRNLEVRVVRAKHLAKRPGSKFYPSPYVKVYLCNDKSVVAKAKTGLAARNPEPRFDQLLIFTEPHQNRLLQIMVIGDYGRMERKSVIGVAIIKLANLDLSKPVEGWYKLYQSG